MTDTEDARPLTVRLLGDIQVRVDGRPIEVDTRKAVALLVYLVVTGTSASRDQLAGLLWEDLDPVRARSTLRRTLSVLRKALGGRWLLTEGDRARTDPEGIWVDVTHVDRLLASRTGHGHDTETVCTRCAGPLEEAARLLEGGEFMAGFSLRDSPEFEVWQLGEAERWRRRRARVLEMLADSLALRGDYSEAAQVARRRVSVSPLDEGAHRQVMLASVWAGDRAGALRQYRECVRVLDDELGVPPLPETAALEEAILCDDIPPRPGGTSEVPRAAGHRAAVGAAGRRLVGRKSEVAALEAIVGGRGGRAAVVSGAPGVGKTRLADEILAMARSDGRRAVHARAYEGEEQLGLVVVGEALRSALAEHAEPPAIDARLASEVSRLVPALAGATNLRPAAPGRDPGGQSRFFDAVCSVLALLLEEDGVVLFDDLQWADAASIELIGYLLRRSERFPMCTVLVWRSPAGRNVETLLRAAEAMALDGRAVVLELGPLGGEEIRELVDETIPGLGESDVVAVTEGSDGIPLVALQYLQLIERNEGTLPRDALALGEVAEVRLRGTSELARQVMAAASLIGRAFDPGEVEAASGRSSDETAQALEELIGAELLHEPQPGLLDFNHDLMREHARASLSAVRRRLLHGRLADHLILRHPGRAGEQAGRIAQHLEAAGRFDEAGGQRMAAGDYARSVFAHQEALVHYQAALGLGHPDTARLHTAIGDLRTLAGDYTAALESYQTAAAHAEGESLARAEHRLGEIDARLGRWDLAAHHFEMAEQGLRRPVDIAALYADWARLAGRRGDEELARRLLASAAARVEGRASAMITILRGLFSADADEGERLVGEGLEEARRRSDTSAESAALTALALIARRRGDLEAAIGRARESLSLVERIGDRHRQAALHDLHADLLHESGAEAEAMAEVTRAVQLFAEVGTGALEPEIWKAAPW